MFPGLYNRAMRLARFRRLARVLALVFVAGLATPAFAVLPSAGNGAVGAVFAYVHADESSHVYAKLPLAPGSAQLSSLGSERSSKPLHHCPGCVTDAQCAVACLGIGLLPASVPMLAGTPLAKAWAISAKPCPAGTASAGDLDPPRPVPVR